MRSLLLLATLLFSITALGQHLPMQPVPLHPEVNGRAVTDIVQAADGSLWIGTERGLVHFDGFSSRFYGANDEQLSGTHIVDLELDRDGILWVSHDASGITRLDPSTLRFEQFTHNANDPNSIVSDHAVLVKDFSQDHVLIGIEAQSIAFMNKKDRSFTYWDLESPIHPDHAIRTAIDTTVWCLGVTRIPPDKWYISCLHPPRAGLLHDSGIILDSLLRLSQADWFVPANSSYQNGQMFIGGWHPRLFIVNIEDPEQRRTIDLGSNITCTLPWNDEQVLVGTELNGAYLVDINSATVIENLASLSKKHINCMFKDKSGKLWVGTNRGLHLHDPELWQFDSMDLRTADPVNEGLKVYNMLFRDDLVEIHSSAGIVRYDQKQQRATTTVVSWEGTPLQVTQLTELEDGSMVLGAEEGFGLYDAGTNQLTELPLTHVAFMKGEENMFRGSLEIFYQVRGILPCDEPDRFLISALGYATSAVDLSNNTYKSGLSVAPEDTMSAGVGGLVNRLFKASDGTYWEALRYGVTQAERNPNWALQSKVAYAHDRNDPHTLAGHDARDLIEGKDGTIWVGTLDGGLCGIRNGQVTRYPNPRSASNSVMGLALDESDRIWCTTPLGFELFDIASSQYFHVPINSGQLSVELQGPIAVSKDGRMAAISGTTVITWRPEDFQFTNALPTPRVTGILVSDKDVIDRVKDQTIELLHQENFVQLSTTVPWLSGEARPQIQYQLGQSSSDWLEAREDGSILFNSLATGKHSLKLRALFADGRIGPQHDWGTLKILPPFYLRWWFILSALVLLSILVYGWHRYRLAQALKLQVVRNRIASDLHDEVGSSLSSIRIGSELVARLSQSKDPKVMELLDRIGKTSNESLKNMSDIVWAIDPKNDAGDALIERMRKNAHELLDDKGIHVKFKADSKLNEVMMPMQTRKDLLLFYKEAIHNVSKYASAEHVNIEISLVSNTLNLTISDDGRGFDTSVQSAGHGMSSMALRAKNLHGQHSINSTLDKGTDIQLQFKLTNTRD